MKDDHTILVDNEGGERYINPENFKELVSNHTVMFQALCYNVFDYYIDNRMSYL